MFGVVGGMGFSCSARDVHFLYDDWVGVGSLLVLSPRVFRVVSNKESSVRECYVVSRKVVLSFFIFGEHCVSQRSHSINCS